MAKCDSCQVLYINGVKCHETGCPDAYKDELRDCKECGQEFEPQDKYQKFCCDQCYNHYCGFYDPSDYEEDEA